MPGNLTEKKDFTKKKKKKKKFIAKYSIRISQFYGLKIIELEIIRDTILTWQFDDPITR